MAILNNWRGSTATAATICGLCLNVQVPALAQSPFQSSGEKTMRAILPSAAQCARVGQESICVLRSVSKEEKLEISFSSNAISADHRDITKDGESARYTRMMVDIIAKSGPFSAAEQMSCIKKMQSTNFAQEISKGNFILRCRGEFQKKAGQFENTRISLEMYVSATQRF